MRFAEYEVEIRTVEKSIPFCATPSYDQVGGLRRTYTGATEVILTDEQQASDSGQLPSSNSTSTIAALSALSSLWQNPENAAQPESPALPESASESECATQSKPAIKS